jgi:hypothetical protein
MVAPLEVPRNAQSGKAKAALVEDDPVPQYNAANNTRPLAVFAGAAATEVQGELLRLLARLRVGDHLPYRHPAVVAGVGMVLIVILGGWVRVGCARLIHVNLLGRLAGSRAGASRCGAILYLPLDFTTSIAF